MFFSIYDNFQVNRGHSLIFSNLHVSNFFDLSNEKYAILDMLSQMKEILMKKLNPNGFNIGINIDKNCRTINHVHIHLITRHKDDVVDPTGGVRNIIPGKGNYTLIH